MVERKHEVERPYPPDYVSAETLAYRLDCSRSTVDAYVRSGLLPPPAIIGNLARWDFTEVRAFIKAHAREARSQGVQAADEYFEGLERATATES